MKTFQKIYNSLKVKWVLFSSLCLGALALSSAQAYQEQSALEAIEGEEVFYAEQLDVDGTYRKDKPQDNSLNEARKELEQRNDDMVKNKIEKMRLEEEMKMAEKLKGMLNGEGKTDPVPAAPMASDGNGAQGSVPPKLTIPFTPSFQISPYAGPGLVFSTFDNYEYKVVTGLNFDTFLHERVTLGLGFQYSNLEISEYKFDWYYNWYFNNFGMNYTTRKIKSHDMSFEIHSKFYLTVESRVRPYIGAGLGFNRSSINYADADQQGSSFYDQRNIPYGNEGYTATYLSGSARGGLDISFTEKMGMNLEVKYSKGLTEAISSKKANPFMENQSQHLLELIGNDLNKSSKLSLIGGLYFMF